MGQPAWLGADCRGGRSIFRHHDCRLGVGRFVAALAASSKRQFIRGLRPRLRAETMCMN
jgi:hypothetical protein